MSDPIPPRPDLRGGVVPPPIAGVAAGNGHPLGAAGGETVPWGGLEAAAVGVIALIVGSVVGAMFGVAIDSRNEALKYALFALGFELGIAATVLAWVRWVRRGTLATIDLYPTRWRDLLRGLVAGLIIYLACVFLIGFVVTQIVENFVDHRVTAPDQIPEDPESPAAVAITGVAIILGAPIGEELYFRGFLFRGLRRRRRFAWAAVISGAIFGAVHYSTDAEWYQSLLLCVPLAFVGFGLAYVYERYRNLLVSMAAHALFNSIGFTFLLFLDN